MSIEAEEWMNIKLPSKADSKPAKRNTEGRDVIFRTLMPGVFLYLIAYYAFVEKPAIADFYCNGVAKLVSNNC